MPLSGTTRLKIGTKRPNSIRVRWQKQEARSNVLTLALDKGRAKRKRIGEARIVSSTKGFVCKCDLLFFQIFYYNRLIRSCQEKKLPWRLFSLCYLQGFLQFQCACIQRPARYYPDHTVRLQPCKGLYVVDIGNSPGGDNRC